MEQQGSLPAANYSVCVQRILDEGWIRTLQVKTIATYRYYASPPRTTLALQLADQAELLGLLNRLHNMGLTVLSVELDLAQSDVETQSLRRDP